MSSEVTLVDYGLGNLFSVARALEHCGAIVQVSDNPDHIRRAPKLLLPGVGAFSKGMGLLVEKGLDQALKESVARGGHLFGICLGMQFLLESSDEFGIGHGLGLIPGQVKAIPSQRQDGGATLRIPHMGWSELQPSPGGRNWETSPLRTTKIGTPMYFVHSFMACPDNESHRLADCRYGDIPVAAMIGRDNIWGAQFHPEKSGEAGLRMLRCFVEEF